MKRDFDIHGYLIKHVGYPLFLVRSRDYSMLGEIKEFDEVFRLPRQKLLQRQWNRLQKLLKEAYEFCPYYTELFDREGLKPESIQSPEDFARLPILTKDAIRKNQKGLLSRKMNEQTLSTSLTAGSTDTPLVFYREKEAIRTKWAQTFSLNKWYDWEIGDRVAYLWGAAMDFHGPLTVKGRIRKFLTNRDLMLPGMPLTPEILEGYRRRLLRFSPKMILGYPQSLYLLALHIESAERRMVKNVGGVISTAEPLLDIQREKLEEVFSCDVYDRYGARETGVIATECPGGRSLHINTEGVYIEIFTKEESERYNGFGEIIVTDLLNTAMPFIRYRIGDMGSLSQQKCECGSELPLMKSITGRTGDIVVLPDGRLIPGITIPTRITKESPGIKQVQVIQEDFSKFTVKYVPAEGFSEKDIEALSRNLKEALDPGLTIDFEEVEDIPRDVSGKSRFCISKVKVDFTGQ